MAENRWAPRPHGYEPARGHDVESESKSATPDNFKRHGLLSTAEWLYEILTSLFSLVLLAGIIVIFRCVDDKPLSAWPDYVSLNAVIAIMTTACSAAIMHGLHFKKGPQKLQNFKKFDEASRGAWGSLKFLASVRWNLATIGASITICRLAFAPLAQQVVKIGERQIPRSDSQVTFGYAHTYDRGIFKSMANAGLLSIPQDPGMQSAIIQGLYDITSPATFSCPGECIWKGSYVSLGFRSECRNVTEETFRSEKCLREPPESSAMNCTMTTPGGLDIPTRHMDTEYQTTYFMTASSVVSKSQEPIPHQLPLPELVRFAVYRSGHDHNFNAVDPNVTECSLHLTAYKYDGARANGNIFAFGNIQKVDFGVRNPWNNGPAHIYTNESRADGIPALSILSHDLIALKNFFTSTSVVSEWVDGNGPDVTDLGLNAALGGDVDIGRRFEKMATSMTDYLRAGSNMQLALGERIDREPFISIRWHYLAGPVAIELAALLFAGITIFANRRSSRAPLWKSSALAVLECTNVEENGLIQAKVKDIKTIETNAENALVRLE
ncbi:hypothetical protein CPLU01_12783 [Colletotrichum plurivorum]|uniref:Uncharacterized protein n=1 Tax=Colletotrichum plurivorum TaxID=2175906 RepID=A0A8H6JVY4_9PEZI|nr:hypothetical protein CPLU01_12783 [Colletotrichum plurivorum]